MKFRFLNIVLLLTLIVYLMPSCKNKASKSNDTNSLSSIKKESDWELLFDGKTTNGWRNFKKDSVSKGWIVQDGNLIALGKGGDLGGDIITDREFENFELHLEWRISQGGNSGIFYHVLEDSFQTVYATGPEYQLIDNVGFPQKLEDWQMAGANYAMHPASNVKLKPIGEFNSTRIIVNGSHVEHWLNGIKVLEFEQWTDDWKNKVNSCKWKDFSAYGIAKKGHIGLQDHGDTVWFRNIKIREIKNKPLAIFNGTNLEGWKIFGTEKWYVENGDLICESGHENNYGYLATEKYYKNFILTLEFKQEADGNSGVFFHSKIEGTKISGWQVEVAPQGFGTGGIYESYGRGWLAQIADEKENMLKPDQWNRMKILVINDHVITWLNGTEMIDLWDKKIGKVNGSIALQIHSGGGIKVRWRNIMITEI